MGTVVKVIRRLSWVSTVTKNKMRSIKWENNVLFNRLPVTRHKGTTILLKKESSRSKVQGTSRRGFAIRTSLFQLARSRLSIFVTTEGNFEVGL